LLDFSFTAGPEAQVDQLKKKTPQPQSQPGATDSTQPQQEERRPDQEAFAFRLFRDEAPTHTVILTHEDDLTARGTGGFMVHSRPRSHYIVSAPSPAQASEYRSVAVSAEYLLLDAKNRRWGLEKPWRVIHISSASSSNNNKSTSAGGSSDSAGWRDKEKKEEEKKRKKRPGKKHRILLRVREKAAREREEAAKKLAVDKVEHLKEKKQRLNRLRKLKRRQKEREKKAQGQTTNSGGGAGDDGSEKNGDVSGSD
jgi:hypothetical protein